MDTLKRFTKKQLQEIVKHNKINNNFYVKSVISYKKNELMKIINDNELEIPDDIKPKEKAIRINSNNPISKYGYKPYDEKQQKEFIDELDNNENYENPLKPLKDYYNKKTEKFEKVSLVEHQERFIKQLVLSDLRGGIAFHGTGTGKTLTAVVCSYYYLKMYPNNKVIFISPSAVLYNFTNSMIQYGLDIKDNRYKFYTFDKYIRKKEIGDNSLVIIDEAHNLRTLINAQETEDDEGTTSVSVLSGTRAYTIKKFASDNCHKIILLTATPFVNKLYDIENLMAMIDNRNINPELFFYTICANDNSIYDYFKYRISHYEKSQDNANFPERREGFQNYKTLIEDKGYEKIDYKEMSNEVINAYSDMGLLFMDDETEQLYNTATNRLSRADRAYWSGQKFISNTLTKSENNIKIQFIFDKIQDDKTSKNIVYSSLYDDGVQLLIKLLEQNDIGYKIISGRETASMKQESVNYYNGYNPLFNDDKTDDKYINNKYRCLIITKAGSEGVDTVKTNNIFLLEPNWNEALTEQIIARAVRFQSHVGVEKNKRFVNVYRLLLLKKSDKPLIDKLFNPEFKEWGLVAKKFKDDRMTLNKLRREKEGAVKVRNKDVMEVLTKEEKEGYNKLTREQRKIFIKNIDFSRYQDKNETINFLSSAGNPSTDLYILVLSKSKQKIIEDMIYKFDTFHNENHNFSFEDYKDDITDEIYDKIQELEKDNIPVDGETIAHLENEAVEPETKKLNELITSSRFQRLQDEQQQKQELKMKKQKIKQLQQYFTGEEDVEKLIELSGIKEYLIKMDDITDETKYNNFSILEPSAGQGHIISGILNAGDNVNIDMVEYDIENRNILNKLVEISPHKLYLSNQNNFLRYTPDKKYDFILMNPPFHLRSSSNPIYTRDIYDFDFIMRAYTMLSPNGVLVAIMSTHFQTGSNPHTTTDEVETFKDFLRDFKPENIKIENARVEWEGQKGYENNDDKNLSYIKSLDIVYLYLREQKNISNLENGAILYRQLYLFNDTLIDKARELEQMTGDINEPIFKTKKELVNYEEKKQEIPKETEKPKIKFAGEEDDEPSKNINNYLLRSKEKKTRSGKSYDENIIKPDIMFL